MSDVSALAGTKGRSQGVRSLLRPGSQPHASKQYMMQWASKRLPHCKNKRRGAPSPIASTETSRPLPPTRIVVWLGIATGACRKSLGANWQRWRRGRAKNPKNQSDIWLAHAVDCAALSNQQPVKIPKRQFLQVAWAAVAAPALPRHTWAHDYPIKPVRFWGIPAKLRSSLVWSTA
jgi:hypothetical protein